MHNNSLSGSSTWQQQVAAAHGKNSFEHTIPARKLLITSSLEKGGKGNLLLQKLSFQLFFVSDDLLS